MPKTTNRDVSSADVSTVEARLDETDAVSDAQVDGPKVDLDKGYESTASGAADTDKDAVAEAERQAALSPRDIDKLSVPTPHKLPDREEP